MQLVRERLPTYCWFMRYRLKKSQLALLEARAQYEPLQRLSAPAAAALVRERAAVQRRLDDSRSTLCAPHCDPTLFSVQITLPPPPHRHRWPTLRVRSPPMLASHVLSISTGPRAVAARTV